MKQTFYMTTIVFDLIAVLGILTLATLAVVGLLGEPITDMAERN